MFPEWPYFEKDEIDAVVALLQSGKVNQWTGEEVEQFQQEFAAACGVKHAIALANGSVALEAALKALGVGPGPRRNGLRISRGKHFTGQG